MEKLQLPAAFVRSIICQSRICRHRTTTRPQLRCRTRRRMRSANLQCKAAKERLLNFVHRVTLVVTDLIWVDFYLNVPSSCLSAQPVLPHFQLPQKNWADSGTSEFKSTQPRSFTTRVTLYACISTVLSSGPRECRR